jgi:hypothetical protein
MSNTTTILVLSAVVLAIWVFYAYPRSQAGA